MKVVARLVEVIGDDEWVDETMKKSIHGVAIVQPGKRLIRSKMIGTYEGITDEEIAKLEAMAEPQTRSGSHPARVDGEGEST